MKKILAYSLALIAAYSLTSCKVDDPFVDRVVAPVLVDIVGASFGAPLSTQPVVSYPFTGKVVLVARLLELDKTNILDHNKGIDSLPVANIPLKISVRNGISLGEVTSNTQGLVSLETTWQNLGLKPTTKDTSIVISWSGNYKGVAFTRLSQVAGKK